MILKVSHLTLKIKWGKKNERRRKEKVKVKRGGDSVTFKPPNYAIYLEIVPSAPAQTSQS